MRRFFLAAAAVFSVLFVLLGCRPGLDDSPFPQVGTIRIVRDTYGVPHIFASNEVDLFYGFGYAVAEDRVRQLFTTALSAAGRSAEIKGQDALESDIRVRSFRLLFLAAQSLQEADERILELIRAYCDGVNANIEERRSELPEWITRLEPVDVAAMGIMNNYDFAVIYNSNSPYNEMRNSGIGSNQFAVAPSRSAGGHALISIDPHMYYDGGYRWTEVHLCTPEFSVTGAVIPGLPLVAMGHNGKVAWGYTVNYPDLADVYAEEINPDNPGQYKAVDGWRDFFQWEETFKVRTSEGLKEETRTLRATHHGPVIRTIGNTAYAVRVAGLSEEGALIQSYQIMRSSSVEELFETFRNPGMNMFNIVAADTSGNIGYFYNALCPSRDPSIDWSKVVPGADPRAEWGGYIPYEQLPRLVNPASGWLQNCNDSPWYVTENSGIEPAALPYRLCTADNLGDRGRRLSELLSADESVTLEEMIAYDNDTLVLNARRFVPELIAAYDARKDSLDDEGGYLRKAVDLFRVWDYRAESDSVAMTVFTLWWFIDRPLSRGDQSPSSQETDERMLSNLGKATRQVEIMFGRAEVHWGEVLRLRHGEKDYPVSGGGIFNALRTAWGRFAGKGLSVVGGSSYQMVVELSDPPAARSCLPFGISENPDSKHFADLTELYSRTEYKPVWYTWDEIKKHIETIIEIVR
jgi:acyl-homoserine-lactone acylase